MPPRKVFSRNGRTDPLVLPAHTLCNSKYSDRDEKIAQLLRLQVPDEYTWESNQLKFKLTEQQIQAYPGLSLARIEGSQLFSSVRRWINGFHAALYRQAVYQNAKLSIILPFPNSSSEDESAFQINEADAMFGVLASVLNDRIKRSLTDGIIAYKGELQYECFWTLTDSGQTMCIFGLRVHNWELLGETPLTGRRGCVGCYICSNPSNAIVYPKPSLKWILPDPTNPFCDIPNPTYASI